MIVAAGLISALLGQLAAAEPIEIDVVGERRAPAVSSLGAAEVRQLPGAFGDPFRAIDSMPGVIPMISGLPYYFVRGAPPGNVGYFVDGMRVPYLFHLLVGPSVVHPALVQQVDLYAGGYPARYGRFAGAIVAAETTPPNSIWHGDFNLRLLDAGGLVEGGFADGRGTILLGGRYSYTGALISLLSKDVGLDYRDYQLRASYQLTPSDTITVLSLGAYDALTTKTAGISRIGFGSEFYRGQLRWDHTLGQTGRLRAAVDVGYDQTALPDGRRARDRQGGALLGLDQPLGSAVSLRASVDMHADAYRFTKAGFVDPDTPPTRRADALFLPRRDSVWGAQAELGIVPRRGLYLTPGARIDYYVSHAATALSIEPRLSSQLELNDDWALLQAVGIARQPPAYPLPLPGLTPDGLEHGLQTAYQSSLGVRWRFLRQNTLTSTLFYDAFRRMTDAVLNDERPTSDVRTNGRAYGAELSVHRKLTQRFGGLLSYTLSRSTRRVEGRNVASAFDRRHVLNVAASCDLGRRWRAGTRVVFYTGARQLERPRDPKRAPAFVRIDARIEKLWRVGKTGHVSFVTEVLNVTGSKEQIGDTKAAFVWPSIGVEGGF